MGAKEDERSEEEHEGANQAASMEVIPQDALDLVNSSEISKRWINLLVGMVQVKYFLSWHIAAFFWATVPSLLEDPCDTAIEQALDSYTLLSICESQGHQEVEDALEIQTKLHNGTLLKSPATTKADHDDEVMSLGGTTLVLGENLSQDRVWEFSTCSCFISN